MTKALTTLTPDQQAVLDQARKENDRSFTPRIDEIKLAQKDMAGVSAGEFYTQSWDAESKQKVFKNIGKNPQIVILRKAATYSYYSEALKRLVAWTSDINGYSEQDSVILFKNDGKSPFIEFRGSYPEFKAYSLKNYTTVNPVEDTIKKLLSFKTVLYVLYENKVYRMFASNPSVTGIAEGEKTADFKKPQLLSLTHFLDNLNDLSSGEHSAACFEEICELDSKYIESTIPFHIIQFKKTGVKPDMEFVLDTYQKLKADLISLLSEDIKRMGKREPSFTEDEKIIGEIQVEDLPF